MINNRFPLIASSEKTVPRAGLTLLFSALLGCAIPSSSLTTVSLSGRLLDPQGLPVSGKNVELVLPAEYGLNEIDLEQGNAKSYGHKDQYARVSTDSLGSFSHTFSAVEYSSRFWLLPPLGSLLSTAPEPMFYIKLPDTDATYYSVLVKEADTVYGVYQIASGASGPEGPVSVGVSKPALVEGELIPDSRGAGEAWIADLEFRYLTPSEKAAQRSGLRSMFDR
jgi:hypothetical protein